MNVSSQHRINCRTPEGTVVTRTVRRRPFPMTAAYALQTTDHKGQTYTDIATPPKYRLVDTQLCAQGGLTASAGG